MLDCLSMKTFLVFSLVALSAGTVAQNPFDDVKVESSTVAGAIHMLHAVGGNISLSVGKDGVLMVDCQFAELEQKNRKAIADLSKEKPRYLINTHWQGDHTGANLGFGQDATILAQENVRQRLQIGGRGKGPAPEGALPVITFKQELKINFNDEEVKLIHLPHGHTDGDTVVIFHGSKVVHVGDYLFVDMFPFIDLESGGSVDGYIQNVDWILQEIPRDWEIIPGHGALASYKDLQHFSQMLHQTSELVQQSIDSGKTRSQVVEAGLPSQWDSWSWDFISTKTWLETLYDGLTVAAD